MPGNINGSHKVQELRDVLPKGRKSWARLSEESSEDLTLAQQYRDLRDDSHHSDCKEYDGNPLLKKIRDDTHDSGGEIETRRLSEAKVRSHSPSRRRFSCFTT